MRSLLQPIVWSAACLIAAAAVVSVRPASAQQPPRFRIGGGANADLLIGDARDFLDGGLGGFLGLEYRLDDRDNARLRVEGGWNALQDDRDGPTQSIATNSVYTLIAAARFVGHLGPIRPFVAPSLGILGVRWRFESGRVDADDSGMDTGLAWGASAGIAVSVGNDHPVEIGIEGRLLDAGDHDFARAPAPSGDSATGFLRTDFAMMSVRLSIMIAI